MEIKSKTEQLILQKIRGEKNSRDAIPLLKDLNANGFNIVDFNDLTLEKSRYKEALPILLKWIDQIKNPDIADTLVRAVSVPWAKRIAVPVLLKKLISERGSDNKELTWSIGNALYFVADKTNIEELLDICKDPAYGDARQMIVLKIGLMKIKKAEDILLSIIDQESQSQY
jgi:hypothetical protein